MGIHRFGGSCAASSEAVCRAVREEGCCIIEDLIGEETMEQIERELSSHVASRSGEAPGVCKEHAAFTGKSTIRMLGVLDKSATLAGLAEEPLVLDVVESLLEPYCERTQLHIGLFRRLQPGEKAQPLHQDRHSTPALRVLDSPSPGDSDYLPGAQWGVAALWALTDCTAENGATRVVPRSHLREGINLDPSSNKTTLTACDDLERQSLKATMRRGSVLLYASATVHGAGANDTDKNRDICLFAYSPAWVRQEESMLLTHPVEKASRLSPRLQGLIGYSLHGHVLGMVDVDGDYGDPARLLPRQLSNCAPFPVLDVRNWRCASTRAAFASALRHACETDGFFYVAGHGLEHLLHGAHKALAEFFASPFHLKERLATSHSRVYPPTSRGWQHKETLDPTAASPDKKESLEVGLESAESGDPQTTPFKGPNNWLPDDLPALEPTFMAAVHALHRLSIEVIQALAASLGCPVDAFSRHCDDPMVLCRGLYYKGGEASCSAHTDYGLVSLLHQTAPGLEVLRGDEWVDAPPLANDAVLVNLGDLMMRWTNDTFKSTVHRVRLPGGTSVRQAIGFFLDANFDAQVAPLAACVKPGQAPRYAPLQAGHHKLAKFQVQTPRGNEPFAMDPSTTALFNRVIHAPA